MHNVSPSVMVYLTCVIIGLGGQGEIKHGLKQQHSKLLHPDVWSHPWFLYISVICCKWGKLASPLLLLLLSKHYDTCVPCIHRWKMTSLNITKSLEQTNQLNRKKKHLPEGWDTSHLLLFHLNLHRTCKTLQDKPVKKKIKTKINITNFVHFTHVKLSVSLIRFLSQQELKA